MAGKSNHTFKAEEKIEQLRERTRIALGRAMSDAVADIQIRLDRGVGVNGESYEYSEQTAKKKGKSKPVDWTDTGILRRSIDFLIIIKDNSVEGLIGIRDLARGKASNKVIHQSLVKRFKGLWGLSNKERTNLINNFFRYFRS
jgi:hypothetical protein